MDKSLYHILSIILFNDHVVIDNKHSSVFVICVQDLQGKISYIVLLDSQHTCSYAIGARVCFVESDSCKKFEHCYDVSCSKSYRKSVDMVLKGIQDRAGIAEKLIAIVKNHVEHWGPAGRSVMHLEKALTELENVGTLAQGRIGDTNNG